MKESHVLFHTHTCRPGAETCPGPDTDEPKMYLFSLVFLLPSFYCDMAWFYSVLSVCSGLCVCCVVALHRWQAVGMGAAQ